MTSSESQSARKSLPILPIRYVNPLPEKESLSGVKIALRPGRNKQWDVKSLYDNSFFEVLISLLDHLCTEQEHACTLKSLNHTDGTDRQA